MGSILSRRIAGVEDIDIQANSAYRYPPKSGNYFASHFFMGGEKFDTPHPEGYLFGENMDLNFLGNRPVQFPYVTPAPHEPVKTLRSLVNIRKDSLRLVRYKDGADSPSEDGEKPRVLYSLEFTFDADARVAITIYCQAVEEFLNGMAVYSPRSPALQSETIHYKRGVSQQFSLPSFKIDFSEWKDDELNFDLDRGVFPVVIQAVVDEGDVVEVTGHAHVLLAAFEKHVDGSFSVKPLKQKQIVDRVSYLLQEIYGIENKNNQETKPSDEENSDNSNECVVCLSDLRDTLILPCRHLCLCNSCADTLRYQASNCPICRLPFRALLQIRAVRKKPGALSPVSFSPVLAQSMDHDEHSCPFKKSKAHPASLASKKPKRETSRRPCPGREFCGTSKAQGLSAQSQCLGSPLPGGNSASLRPPLSPALLLPVVPNGLVSLFFLAGSGMMSEVELTLLLVFAKSSSRLPAVPHPCSLPLDVSSLGPGLGFLAFSLHLREQAGGLCLEPPLTPGAPWQNLERWKSLEAHARDGGRGSPHLEGEEVQAGSKCRAP
ncbi:E3 ubiquitin-protein ligase MGRN1 isoform X4 [Hyaena hyaena]|uniref:E3 ubiquitin-protein ligase MGRN1 isoform X4 n=1 Tax=Hyaena hyaena TaxID=95912 RepID=UPI001920A542|nr:E3 ubiquitin-protein ligase MGRN1 isoform X4 [Hyaena hyaena]